MRTHVIAAMSRNGGIGLCGKLPWRCRKDMEYFKNLTIGEGNNAVLMGRKTWESLPAKLPKRENIVVSSKKKKLENAIVFNSVIAAKEYCEERAFDELWIIGGRQVYQQCDILTPERYYITMIDKDIKCDTFMPNIPIDYTLEETIVDVDAEDTLLYFNVYTRDNPVCSVYNVQYT